MASDVLIENEAADVQTPRFVRWVAVVPSQDGAAWNLMWAGAFGTLDEVTGWMAGALVNNPPATIEEHRLDRLRPALVRCWASGDPCRSFWSAEQMSDVQLWMIGDISGDGWDRAGAEQVYVERLRALRDEGGDAYREAVEALPEWLVHEGVIEVQVPIALTLFVGPMFELDEG